LKTLSFTTEADFYVHYFVLHPTPIEGYRFGMCIVGDHTSNKVSIDLTNNHMRFHVNTAFLDEQFREAIRSVVERSDT
jgi:predicted lipase